MTAARLPVPKPIWHMPPHMMTSHPFPALANRSRLCIHACARAAPVGSLRYTRPAARWFTAPGYGPMFLAYPLVSGHSR